MKFSVKARSATGETYTTEVEAKGRSELYEQFHGKGDTFISATEVSSSPFGNVLTIVDGFIGSVKLHEKVIFARNLGAMLGAGLALSKALSVLERQTKNKKFKLVIKTIIDDIGRGDPLSLSLSRHKEIFSNLFISMVKAGEESGGLTEALDLVSGQMEKSYLLVNKVRGALIYPGIIFSVMIIVGVLMLIYVVPALTSTFKEMHVALPATTQFVVAVSDFLKDHTLLFFASVFGVLALLFALSKTYPGRRTMDYLSVRIPIIGNITKETNAARTARTLSSLLSSGVSVVNAITITRDVMQNSFYKEVLDKAAERIQKGAPISGVFIESEKLYPILVGEMMEVGEETGKLSEMLLKIAIFYEGEVEQKTKDLSTVIEPFLMVFVGAAVGFFAISMISPTYSLVDTIQ